VPARDSRAPDFGWRVRVSAAKARAFSSTQPVGGLGTTFRDVMAVRTNQSRFPSSSSPHFHQLVTRPGDSIAASLPLSRADSGEISMAVNLRPSLCQLLSPTLHANHFCNQFISLPPIMAAVFFGIVLSPSRVDETKFSMSRPSRPRHLFSPVPVF